MKYGCKVEIIKIFQFERGDLFSDYVKHFYNIKVTSTGVVKQLAKLQLNTLYGYFGRKLDIITTINIKPEQVSEYLSNYLVKKIVRISDEIVLLLIDNNKSKDFFNNLKKHTSLNAKNVYNLPIKTNVAIASAITA